MFDETKIVLEKAFKIGKILFSLGGERYSLLLKATSAIKPPTRDELTKYIINGISLEEAIAIEMKNRYKEAALSAGFDEKHGIAMLEYAVLLQEMRDK